ncbi:MAG: metallophosphoesterase [Planctomycetaceae bacterium]|nr:metallophosphoesterase [Planctomycetaceae bacterium]
MLVFVAFGWSGERVKILITNDVHGHVATHVANNKIGYSLVKSYKDKLRHGNNAVLLFDAGDSFHGGSFANRDNGRSVAEAMRLTGYDLLAPGNHEFSYNSKTNNPHYYAELSKMVLDEKPVACNILFAGEPWRAVQPYKIYEFASFSLVVTGVLTPNMFRDARNTVGFDCTLLGISGRPQDKVFAEISAAVQQRLAAVVKEAKHEAKSKRVITLVLSHVGYEIGNEAEFPAGALTGRDLLRVEGVDIVADAHSHILIDPFCSHGSLYACTGKHLQSLLEITIQELDRQHIVDLRLVTAKDMQVQPDPVVEQFVRGKVHEAGLDVVVGFNREELSDDGIELRPTRLGKAICEAMAASYRTDAAIVHAGCYRSGLPKGVIDKMTFDDFMPFSGEVVILSMSRKQFEDITSNENRGSASEFVQFSCGKNIADVLTVALPKYLAEKDPRFKSFHPIAFPEKPMLDAIAEQLFEPVTNTEAADLETAA